MAGALARLQVQDVDAPASSSSATTTTLFVRCRQKALAFSVLDGSSSTVRLPALQLDVAEGHALWRGEVTEKHKPTVLDCAASEYLNMLESVFSARSANGTSDDGGDDTKCAFVYKWSRKSGILTLMEESASGFAMKYTSLTLAPVSNNDSEKQAIWTSLLQEIVDVGAHTAQETTRQKTLIKALEKLLKEKDAVLEAALLAKQQLEDQLFEGFCAVLNAKKDEIQRLQHELAVAQVQASSSLSNSNGKSTNGKSASSKKPRQPRAAKAKGAKLKPKLKVKDEEDDEEERQGSSSEEDEEEADSQDDDSDSHGDDDDDDNEEMKRPSRSRRAKHDAIGAYSQLSSSIYSSSQVCTADDVLSDLDAIMKQEVEANDAIQAQAGNNNSSSNKAKRPRALTSALSTRRTKEKKRKSESSSQDEKTKENAIAKSHAKKATAAKPKSAPGPRPPPAAAPVDSEEEDILDMLA